MLVDENGRFLTQREIPAMALIGARMENGHLQLYSKTNPVNSMSIPLEPNLDWMPRIRTEIWSDRCGAYQYPNDVNHWFSSVLNRNARLVYMSEQSKRAADGRYAPKGQYVSFADGYPYLLIGQASLDALNTRLDQAVPMNRFRPNLVFTGGTAFQEDQMTDFTIGDVAFRGVKPCARCILPNTNQDTAQRAAEPLKTMSAFRTVNHKVLFGQNVVLLGQNGSRIQVGQLMRNDE